MLTFSSNLLLSDFWIILTFCANIGRAGKSYGVDMGRLDREGLRSIWRRIEGRVKNCERYVGILFAASLV